ncbi:hypothetical protein chiPu_0003319 [Chiloscyllium punctatum]|uniref:Uncharacterized protein n=1 Tax=Chiloscyllium punctatum TaxID=137246 RepID=A0A401S3H0_CHIPU|nr:hypothetical protein [Chiloscyllium punctatum]
MPIKTSMFQKHHAFQPVCLGLKINGFPPSEENDDRCSRRGRCEPLLWVEPGLQLSIKAGGKLERWFRIQTERESGFVDSTVSTEESLPFK